MLRECGKQSYEYEQLAIVDTLVPNLTKGTPVKINRKYHFVVFVEIHIFDDTIKQFVVLKNP